MKQYTDLLLEIKSKGTIKPAARENMPGTLSLFGHQFRHNLVDGFPLLTTKKLSIKNITTELIWFLKGDTNVKYLIDNGCNIWNQDAYNYYAKILKNQNLYPITFNDFIKAIKSKDSFEVLESVHGGIPKGYTLGDCGFQYGRVWREWWGEIVHEYDEGSYLGSKEKIIDQISNLIEGLKNNPQSRRHLVTALDPANDTNLALYWCHCMFQFNCRPLTSLERSHYAVRNNLLHRNELMFPSEYEDQTLEDQLNGANVPKYYLDCQLYQRSADVFLGVPYNIASYALLTHIVAKIVNMVPGEYIHTFGDVHIYDNHKDQVDEQLTREPKNLPKIVIDKNNSFGWSDWDYMTIFDHIDHSFFEIEGYNPHPTIKGKLSTGLK